MRSQDLEGLRQRCAEYLEHIGTGMPDRMSIRELLNRVLDPIPNQTNQDVRQSFESTKHGRSQTLADQPAGDILKVLDRMIDRARRKKSK